MAGGKSVTDTESQESSMAYPEAMAWPETGLLTGSVIMVLHPFRHLARCNACTKQKQGHLGRSSVQWKSGKWMAHK